MEKENPPPVLATEVLHATGSLLITIQKGKHFYPIVWRKLLFHLEPTNQVSLNSAFFTQADKKFKSKNGGYFFFSYINKSIQF